MVKEKFTLDQLFIEVKTGKNLNKIAGSLGVDRSTIKQRLARNKYTGLAHFAANYKISKRSN